MYKPMKVKSILLIEDDELDIISVQRVFKKNQYDIKLHTAFNGIEALELLTGPNRIPIPDVILLDLNMPKMNGIEFLRALRKMKEFTNVKIFIMTTSNEETDRLEVSQLGIAGYLIKPLNFNDNNKNSSSMESFIQFQMLKILDYGLN